jgi:3-isopropylmalate/(R)-2-methylmalate dehydratase large subunit
MAPRLLYIDRHLVHEVTSPQAFEGLRIAAAGCAHRRRRWRSWTTMCRPQTAGSDRRSGVAIAGRDACAERRDFGVEYYSELDRRQGIVHIVGPEQGFTLPG